LPIVRRLATDGTEAEQRAAFTALGRLDQPEAPQLLVLGLDRLAAGKVHVGAQVELLDAVDKSEDPRVQARWNELKAQWARSGDALAPYRSALGAGNAWRGSRIFQDHPMLACIRCHQVNGEGGQAGPDLTLIGAQKSPDYLLESIVEPNAQIAQGFNLVTLKLKDGSYESGSLMSESAKEIVLKRADGSEAKLDASTVVERQAGHLQTDAVACGVARSHDVPACALRRPAARGRTTTARDEQYRDAERRRRARTLISNARGMAARSFVERRRRGAKQFLHSSR